MAYLQHFHCHTCHASYQGVDNGTYPHKCNLCISTEKKEADCKWKAAREEMSMIDRIRDIEQFMLNQMEGTKLLRGILF
jgi:hypothetical protein